MRQMKMLRPSGPVTHRDLPAGYRYEFYTGTEAERLDWLAMNKGAILPDDDPKWFDLLITRYPDVCPEKDLFFVVSPDGRRVATSASVVHSGGAGYVHMVAALPEVRGKGIGHAMLSFSLETLEARGVPYIYLTTDDFRLAAIKTYLDADFRPVLWEDPESDMAARWDAVIDKLGYRKVEYLPEKYENDPT
ncbi:MAG: GNAT family N-acetyltransferase [Clostridia bacterium]|nr:GNAT family N-acetyltransferase [Clostridia bacterium]